MSKETRDGDVPEKVVVYQQANKEVMTIILSAISQIREYDYLIFLVRLLSFVTINVLCQNLMEHKSRSWL